MLLSVQFFRIFPIFIIIATIGAFGCGTGSSTEASIKKQNIESGIKPNKEIKLDTEESEAKKSVHSSENLNRKFAPEFPDDANWINSDPLSISGLKGKVVLVDFWTYTCVNCIRTLPYLKMWHKTYGDKGLVIVGVHSPEFEFEKNEFNVKQAIEQHGIQYPVVQDNDFSTWQAYKNSAWPAKYLTDANGMIRYSHIGEGSYKETESRIRSLLENAGVDLSAIDPVVNADPELDSLAYGSGDPASQVTRELYGGYLRNFSPVGLYIADPIYYQVKDTAQMYFDDQDHRNHFFYLEGEWLNGPESIIHARKTDTFEDFIALKFYASSVNAVVNSAAHQAPFEVEVTIDGKTLRTDQAGSDMIIEKDRSYFMVDQPKMYEVVRLFQLGEHELELSSKEKGFSLYAFTFGGYSEGP